MVIRTSSALILLTGVVSFLGATPTEAKQSCKKAEAALLAKKPSDFAKSVVTEHDNESGTIFKSERNHNCRGKFLSPTFPYAYSYWRAVLNKKTLELTYTHGFTTDYRVRTIPDLTTISYGDVTISKKPLLMGELGENVRIFGVDLTEDEAALLTSAYTKRPNDERPSRLAILRLTESGQFVDYGTAMLLDEFVGFYTEVANRVKEKTN